MTPNVFETQALQSLDTVFQLKSSNSYKLTVDALKEYIEDTVTWYRKFMLIQEIVLDPLLVMFVAVEIVLLKVVQKS